MKDTTFFFLCVLGALLLTAPHANAEINITYPQQYYDFGSYNDQMYTNSRLINSVSWGMDSKDTFGIYMELRRQTILMEKQNELIAEQNEILKMRYSLVCNQTEDGYMRSYTCKVSQ